MNKIKTFTFFRSYYEALNELSDKDKKALLVAIVDYIFADITPEFKGTKKSVWTLIEPTLSISKSKSNNTKLKSNQNQNEIKMKSNQNQKSSSVLPKEKEKEKEKEKDKDKGIGVREKDKREKPVGSLSPTLTEILDHAKEVGIEDKDYCEKFFNHYEAIGWVNGAGNKITNWKPVFNNWVKKDKSSNQEKPKTQKSKLDSVFDKFMEEDDD